MEAARLLDFDVVVLGAGAAGLMCAIEAGRRGRRVAVLDHADKIGKKILISGGGRCNFTNIHTTPENFISANPHFHKSQLARYTPRHFIELVEKHGIPYHEKTLGQLFCDRSSRDIVGMLERECDDAGARIFVNTRVTQVARNGRFLLQVATGDAWRAEALVVATGGLSIPKMGATAFGYDLARQFGLKIREPWPALVPFTYSPGDAARYAGLAGVSLEVVTSIGAQRFREKMLFTHRGLSGPAILQISSYWRNGRSVTIDLAPGQDVTAPLRQAGARRDLAAARSLLRAVWPTRFADRWLEDNAPEAWTSTALAEFERRIHTWPFMPAGTEGYAKAEVTAGGVDTSELSARSMEARAVPGLFFIGEVVDVTGHLGGFNFQWAWASGAACGREL